VVAAGQFWEGCPGLARMPYPLPFVLAYRAARRGRLVAGMLDPAGDADWILHTHPFLVEPVSSCRLAICSYFCCLSTYYTMARSRSREISKKSGSKKNQL
jgi:hypothetical protein